MARLPELAERDECNQLTAIKLALQLLERRAELPVDQQELLRTALAAADRLSARLLEGVLDRRRPGLLIQAQELQDHDDHHDRADDRQDHDLPLPARAGPVCCMAARGLESASASAVPRAPVADAPGWREPQLSVSQLLVVGAPILTVLDLLNVGLRGLPLLPLAVLLLCLAWLVP